MSLQCEPSDLQFSRYVHTIDNVPEDGKLSIDLDNVKDAVSIYIDNIYYGGIAQQVAHFDIQLAYPTKTAELQILLQNQGIRNFGNGDLSFAEKWAKKGLLGSVKVNGAELSTGSWKHLAGLKGEHDQVNDS
jgi:hypothetical protein